MLELFFPLPAPELASDVTSVALAPQHVLLTHQSLQFYRTSGVDSTCTDPNLCTKAVPEPIREPGASVPKSASGVHSSDERGDVLFGLCDDRVGVMRGMGVYVFYCAWEGGDSQDGQGEGEVVGRVVCLLRPERGDSRSGGGGYCRTERDGASQRSWTLAVGSELAIEGQRVGNIDS